MPATTKMQSKAEGRAMTDRVLTIQEMDTVAAEPGPTQVLAEFATATTFDDLPAQVIEDAKLAILDWFGSMLAGALEPQACIAREVVQLLGTADDAALFPHARSSAAGAAL